MKFEIKLHETKLKLCYSKHGKSSARNGRDGDKTGTEFID